MSPIIPDPEEDSGRLTTHAALTPLEVALFLAATANI
jgi:hypothetical protein